MKTDLNTKVAEWYDESFGMDTEFKDDMGKYIDDKITFKDVADCIENKPNEFYSLTGVSDSVVRERVFAELAKILDVDYDRVYDRWIDKSAPSLYESQQIVEERLAVIRMNIVQSYVLEGKSFDEAIKLAEDTITPETVYRVPQLPGYKSLRNKVEHFFKVCDDIIDYKQSKEYLDDPIGAFQAEADFCDDVADFLGSINLKGFDKEFTKEFMNTTGKEVEHLDNVVDGLEDALKNQDRSTYVDDSGKAKPRTARRPGEVAKEALRGLRDFFAKFGLDFDYNPDFDYKTTKDVDYRKFVADSKQRILKEKKTGSITQDVEIECYVVDEFLDKFDDIHKDLKDLMSGLDDFTDTSDKNTGYICLFGKETANYTYFPEVGPTAYYGPEPEEFDVDFEFWQDDLFDEVKAISKKYGDGEEALDIEQVYCEVSEPSPDADYDDRW